MTTILVFGDSIAWGAWDAEKGGWVNRLWLHLAHKMKEDESLDCMLYNLGVSGDTTLDLLGRFEQETRNRLTESENEERVVIVFQIGTNDCALENGKEQVSIDAFKNNCIKLVKFAQRITDCIYFVSLAQVDESKSMCLPWASHVYKNENIVRYNSALRNLCGEYEVGFIDVALEWSKADYPKLLEDGIHPNAAGHELIFNIVRKRLEDDGIIGGVELIQR